MLDFLHGVSLWIEDFSNRHQHSIALIEAVSTTAAVIVALVASYAATQASRPKLAAGLAVMKVLYAMPSAIEGMPTYIAVRLTNTGTVPVRLHSNLFSWQLPFVKSAWMAIPVDEQGDGHISQRRYPFVVMPKTSETIYLTSLENFRSKMPEILDNGRFGRRISARLLRGIVYTDDGSYFRASLNSSFRKELGRLNSGATS